MTNDDKTGLEFLRPTDFRGLDFLSDESKRTTIGRILTTLAANRPDKAADCLADVSYTFAAVASGLRILGDCRAMSEAPSRTSSAEDEQRLANFLADVTDVLSDVVLKVGEADFLAKGDAICKEK